MPSEAPPDPPGVLSYETPAARRTHLAAGCLLGGVDTIMGLFGAVVFFEMTVDLVLAIIYKCDVLELWWRIISLGIVGACLLYLSLRCWRRANPASMRTPPR